MSECHSGGIIEIRGRLTKHRKYAHPVRKAEVDTTSTKM
jgi:hypothetical protein